MTVIDHETSSQPARDEYRAFEGVRSRRMMAAAMDLGIIALLCIPVGLMVFVLGVATLGLGFLLYGIMIPALALTYSGLTMGSRAQATVGMRIMDIHVEQLDGKPLDFVTAAAHSFLFWACNVVLTPFVLLATLFTDRKRTVHDILTGTIVRRGSY